MKKEAFLFDENSTQYKILKIMDESLLELLEKRMKHSKAEIEDLIFELIDNDVITLGFSASELNDNIECYFEKTFLENLEKRMKKPETTIEQVIKEIEDNVKSEI